MATTTHHVIVYTGGRIVTQAIGPTYVGGGSTIIPFSRGISLHELRARILIATMVQGHINKITYRYPCNRYPHHTYTYIAFELVNDSSIDLMFDVIQSTAGYTAELYVETVEMEPTEMNYHPNLEHYSSPQRPPTQDFEQSYGADAGPSGEWSQYPIATDDVVQHEMHDTPSPAVQQLIQSSVPNFSHDAQEDDDEIDEEDIDAELDVDLDEQDE